MAIVLGFEHFRYFLVFVELLVRLNFDFVGLDSDFEFEHFDAKIM